MIEEEEEAAGVSTSSQAVGEEPTAAASSSSGGMQRHLGRSGTTDTSSGTARQYKQGGSTPGYSSDVFEEGDHPDDVEEGVEEDMEEEGHVSGEGCDESTEMVLE